MQPQETVHAPYSLKTLVLFGLGAAFLSLVFSISMLWLQAAGPDDHIAGRVVSVEENSIVIESGRGDTTTILITPETRIGDISPLSSLSIGTQVMAGGTFLDRETFRADGIRKFDKRPK